MARLLCVGFSWSSHRRGFSASLREGCGRISALTPGPNGHLYGATLSGGTKACYNFPFGCGTVFELTPNPNGSWKERVIYSFSRGDGLFPYGKLIVDKAENIYGTAYYGGNVGRCMYGFDVVNCGTVFELSPAQGGTWTGQVLMNFANGVGGGNLDVGLALDRLGNLYGTSFYGRAHGAGLVFEIVRTQ